MPLTSSTRPSFEKSNRRRTEQRSHYLTSNDLDLVVVVGGVWTGEKGKGKRSGSCILPSGAAQLGESKWERCRRLGRRRRQHSGGVQMCAFLPLPPLTLPPPAAPLPPIYPPILSSPFQLSSACKRSTPSSLPSNICTFPGLAPKIDPPCLFPLLSPSLSFPSFLPPFPFPFPSSSHPLPTLHDSLFLLAPPPHRILHPPNKTLFAPASEACSSMHGGEGWSTAAWGPIDSLRPCQHTR